MENDKIIGIAIAMFLAVLIGAILVNIISTQTAAVTVKSIDTSAIDISAARMAGNTLNGTYNLHIAAAQSCPMGTAWKAYIDSDCRLSSVSVTNGSTALVSGVDYNLNASCTSTTGAANGDIVFLSSAKMNATLATNTTYVTSSYCQDQYLPGWGGTVANLVPGFFVLAILLGAVGAVYFILKSEGIDF